MWGNDSYIRNSAKVGSAFANTTKALEGLEREEARRVLRATWIALALDEADPKTAPDADAMPRQGDGT